MALLTRCEFHERLMGWNVYDESGVKCLKWELWNTYKDTATELELIADKMHPSYEFAKNAEYWEFVEKYESETSEP